jgi:hypothetical protein
MPGNVFGGVDAGHDIGRRGRAWLSRCGLQNGLIGGFARSSGHLPAESDPARRVAAPTRPARFERPQVLTVAARLTEDRAVRQGHGTITAVFRYFRDLGRRQQ